MVKAIATTVFAEPSTMKPVVIRAGESIPEWAVVLVTNPEVTGDDMPPVTSGPVEEVEQHGHDEQGDSEVDPESPIPDKSWKKNDLIDWAEAHDVDLGEASTKDDIWDVIEAYLED